jgi:hypothetical protein
VGVAAEPLVVDWALATRAKTPTRTTETARMLVDYDTILSSSRCLVIRAGLLQLVWYTILYTYVQ